MGSQNFWSFGVRSLGLGLTVGLRAQSFGLLASEVHLFGLLDRVSRRFTISLIGSMAVAMVVCIRMGHGMRDQAQWWNSDRIGIGSGSVCTGSGSARRFWYLGFIKSSTP